MAKWRKFNLSDFHIDKNGKPYLYAKLSSGTRGLQDRTKPVFFASKVLPDKKVLIPEEDIERLEKDRDWKVRFPRAMEELKIGKTVLEEIEGMPIELDKFSLIAQAIQSENETVIFYQNLQDMFPEWKDVLQDIINEELKHIGQFEALRDASSVTVATKVEQGQNEADAQMRGIAIEEFEDEIKYSFVELDPFKKSWKHLGFGDEELRLLQKTILDLHNGAQELGTNLYKIRFSVSNKGKSSSNRTVYYLKTDKVYLIYAFSKQDEANISEKDLEVFRLLAKTL